MKRILTVLLAALLALAACASLAEGEGEPEVPDTGAEPASCAHEHLARVCYFDMPYYTPLDGECHSVSGRATVEEVCEDCHEVVAVYTENQAEEVRPHTFRNGVCVLCGYADLTPQAGDASGTEAGVQAEDAPWQEIAPQGEEALPEEEILPEEETWQEELPQAEDAMGEEAPQAEEPAREAAPQERIVMIPAGRENPDQYFYTVTGRDLEETGETLVLWPEGCDAALVLEADRLREEIEVGGGSFTAEFEKPGSQNVRTSLRLYDADGTESRPESRGISLRIYGENTGSPLWVSWTAPDGQSSSEEASWVLPGGYWSVQYLGDGFYTY